MEALTKLRKILVVHLPPNLFSPAAMSRTDFFSNAAPENNLFNFNFLFAILQCKNHQTNLVLYQQSIHQIVLQSAPHHLVVNKNSIKFRRQFYFELKI